MNMDNRKLYISAAAAIIAVSMFTGCSMSAESQTNDGPEEAVTVGQTVNADTSDEKSLSNVNSSADSENLNIYNIKSAGTYTFTGISDKQIIVDTEDGEVVLILSGAEISSSDGPAIYVKSAGNVVVKTADGTSNVLRCTASAESSETKEAKVTSAVYSKSDITFGGNGELTVDSENGAGINSKGNITADSGKISVTSRDNGISADGSYIQNTADVTVTAGGGNQNGEAHNNGRSGMFGGRGQTDKNSSLSDDSSDDLAKGIKTDVSLEINGGKLTVDSSDDSLHSDADIIVRNGEITLNSGDDAVHAENSLTIENGTVNVPVCYEGIEGYFVTINGGVINVTASDDGINAVAPDGDSDTFMKGGDDSFIVVNGGTVNVRSNGDGMDSNGKLELNGGDVTVIGPANSDNSAFDSDGKFIINGGNVIGLGSSQMAASPAEGDQPVICITAQITGGSELKISDGENDVFTFTPDETYSSAIISIPALEKGRTYTAASGENELGTAEMTGSVAMIGDMMGGMGFGGFGGHGGRRGGNTDDADIGRNNEKMPRQDESGQFTLSSGQSSTEAQKPDTSASGDNSETNAENTQQMPDGGFPQRPDGEFPQTPDGEFPQRPDGGFPQTPDGGFPQMPDGEFPQRPDGEFPQMPDGEFPQRPDGESPQQDPPADETAAQTTDP